MFGIDRHSEFVVHSLRSEEREKDVLLVYRDVSTARPFVDPLFVGVGEDLIHLDSSTAGWGCCCLQVTFQAESFEESLHLHDQLLVLCPLMVRERDIRSLRFDLLV